MFASLIRIATNDRPFLERFRDWDLDPMDVWNWAVELGNYYLHVYGTVGYFIVGAAVILLLLSFDLTHGITSQILSGTYKLLMVAVLFLVGKVLQLIAIVTHNMAVARVRDMVRFWQSRFRKEQPGEDV